MDIALACRVRRLIEGLLYRALFAFHLQRPGVGLVGPEFVVDDDAVGKCYFGINDCGQRNVFDFDQVECIARCRFAGCKDGNNAVAGVTHLVHRKRIVRGVLHVLRYRPGTGHWRSPHVGEISARVDGHHSFGGLGSIDIDRGDPCMRIRRAQDRQVQCAGDVEVVGELGFTGEQGGILAAQHALADHGGWAVVDHGHGVPPTSCRPQRVRT